MGEVSNDWTPKPDVDPDTSASCRRPSDFGLAVEGRGGSVRNVPWLVNEAGLRLGLAAVNAAAAAGLLQEIRSRHEVAIGRTSGQLVRLAKSLETLRAEVEQLTEGGDGDGSDSV